MQNTLEPKQTIKISSLKELTSQQRIQLARYFGSKLKDANFSTTQLRRLLSQVNKYRQKINENNWNELEPQISMLAPRAVYQIVKTYRKKDGSLDSHIDAFKNYLSIELEGLKSSSEFTIFGDFMEAVVAYFKDAGGKDE
ncbi:MAG: type III-A CRISPR-associated protein Csm2 [Cyanobacteria bacterium]|nr:type III-A CRISPR-associated protein Csm2 [Cyanobacteriota bacterium]